MRGILIAFIVTSCLLMAACTSPPGGVLVIPLNPNSKHEGKNYAQWSQLWWQWALSQQVANHPLFDTTGSNAAVGQTGDVWFLGATFGDPPTVTRTITAPSGTAFFFPLINFEEDSAFAPEMSVTDMVNELDTKVSQTGGLNLIVDGIAMPDLSLLRATVSTPFSVTLPATDDVYTHFGVDAGGTVNTVVSDGFWAFIDALPAGTHTLTFGGGQGATNVQANYAIHVLP